MNEHYNLHIETFDPKEKIDLPNILPGSRHPMMGDTMSALAKAFEPSATVGFTMREAEAVGLICKKGTIRERLASRALRLVGFFRHFRKHPQTAFTDMFKDKGRPNVTQRCRNIAAAALGVNDPQVREALRQPMKDLPPGNSTAAFDAFRQLVTL